MPGSKLLGAAGVRPVFGHLLGGADSTIVLPFPRCVPRVVNPSDLPPAELRLLLQGAPPVGSAALAVLYNRYRLHVLKVIIRNGIDSEAAEDVLHDTFIQVQKSAHKYKGDVPFSAWLSGVAKHRAVTHFRKNAKSKRNDSLDSEDAPELQDHAIDLLKDTEYELNSKALRGCIERLSPEHRTVIDMTLLHDFSESQIAEAMGCPKGTVKSRLSIARDKIEKCMHRRLNLRSMP